MYTVEFQVFAYTGTVGQPFKGHALWMFPAHCAPKFMKMILKNEPSRCFSYEICPKFYPRIYFVDSVEILSRK